MNDKPKHSITDVIRFLEDRQLEQDWDIRRDAIHYLREYAEKKDELIKKETSMSPEELTNYIQQVIRTILTDPNPSILDVALLPILATDPRNGFSEETRKELMNALTNHCTLLEQMEQINMSHADITAQFNNSMQATAQQMDDNFRQCWIYSINGWKKL